MAASTLSLSDSRGFLHKGGRATWATIKPTLPVEIGFTIKECVISREQNTQLVRGRNDPVWECGHNRNESMIQSTLISHLDQGVKSSWTQFGWSADRPSIDECYYRKVSALKGKVVIVSALRMANKSETCQNHVIGEVRECPSLWFLMSSVVVPVTLASCLCTFLGRSLLALNFYRKLFTPNIFINCFNIWFQSRVSIRRRCSTRFSMETACVRAVACLPDCGITLEAYVCVCDQGNLVVTQTC